MFVTLLQGNWCVVTILTSIRAEYSGHGSRIRIKATSAAEMQKYVLSGQAPSARRISGLLLETCLALLHDI
jgi:hypothetical protein